ncbi:hypothetical protein Mgra_00008887 [Meloidogyne graminicola]|uniref:L-Fucosyltransferase n=1 Tax=Meloidogyne graminicola TaxID=189291 RepID=A0A8S9ZEM2_9BILA|nr:hypothetical protein Mgra_00008887 [Meloidogyne graminicola]
MAILIDKNNKIYLIILFLSFGIILYFVNVFFCFPENITKYSTNLIQLKLNYNEIEEWQKNQNLNLKYINLTKINEWRRNNLTKFILMELPQNWNGECGGLANQLWRLVIIYIWSIESNRYPGIFNNSAWTCDKLNSPNEIEETFPVIHKIFAYFKPEDIVNNTKYQSDYNIKNMIKSKEKYLRIPPPPQIHNLFKNYTNQIKELFLFSNKIKININNYINKLFNNNRVHKLCIHTRLGDFGNSKWPKHHPSKKDFTEESTKFVFNEIKINNTNIMLILLGTDQEFIKNLTFNGIEPKTILIPKNMSRAEDIYFSTTICNTLIITASASTFGWWIGYLLKLNNIKSTIYFYYDFNFNSIYQRNDFPLEWIPLKFNSEKKKITKHLRKLIFNNFIERLLTFKIN